MSETQLFVGKLTPVEMTGSIDETCERLCGVNGWVFDDYYDSWTDVLTDNGDGRYCIINSTVYQFVGECDIYADIFKASLTEDGSYSVILKYYDGVCSFSEAATKALNSLEV